jgi:hypothetical protein
VDTPPHNSGTLVPRKTHWASYESVSKNLLRLLPGPLRRHRSGGAKNNSGGGVTVAAGAGGAGAVPVANSNSGDKSSIRPRKHILSRPDAARLNHEASSAAAAGGRPPALVRSYSSPLTNPDGSVSIGQMVLYPNRVLGTGSMGTVVYAGTFEGRPCAIKRMVKEFFGSANAAQEIALLIQSDTHPNVLRYYAKDEDSSFIYLALEQCVGTIQDLVDGAAAAAGIGPNGMPNPLPPHQIDDTIQILLELMTGIAHLHQLRICHRDIKPGNVRTCMLGAADAMFAKSQEPRIDCEAHFLICFFLLRICAVRFC